MAFSSMAFQHVRQLAAVNAAMLVFIIPFSLAAQEHSDAPVERKPLSLGTGVGLGWGPFATDSGPWADVFGIVDAGVLPKVYLRLEPGFAAGTISGTRRESIGTGTAESTERLDTYGVMARGKVGYDLTEWLTVRLGLVGGYLVGTYESSLCPDESYSRGQFGYSSQAAVRLGEERRLEVGIQAEVLARFANPRCRPRADDSLPVETRFQAPYLLVTEASRGSLLFLSLRIGYIWF